MELFFLCIKIFFARILDVSLGTFRTIITVKGKSVYASFIGFVEILIWFLVVKEALNTPSTSIWIGISYALGFASGTWIGSVLSQKLIKGKLTVQAITSSHDQSLIDAIREKGYAVSVMDIDGKNKEEDKYLLFMEIDNHKLQGLKNLIKEKDPKAFLVITETKYVQNGYFSK